MTLTEADKQSSLWIRLKEDFERQLIECRCKNDGELDPLETSRLRGRIFQIKSFLALAQQPAPVAPMSDHLD